MRRHSQLTEYLIISCFMLVTANPLKAGTMLLIFYGILDGAHLTAENLSVFITFKFDFSCLRGDICTSCCINNRQYYSFIIISLSLGKIFFLNIYFLVGGVKERERDRNPSRPSSERGVQCRACSHDPGITT